MIEGNFSPPLFDLTGPIVRSRLEPDFYKFTMGQLIWRKYGHVETTFAFASRTPKARIGEVVDVADLRESNTYAAMTTGLVSMGTSGHELPMIILDSEKPNPQWLRRAQRQVIDDWWDRERQAVELKY